MSTFQGLPTALFEFFVDLAQNNSKEFWEANRQRWQRDVKAPMSELVDELSATCVSPRTNPLTSSGQELPALLRPPAESVTTSACRLPVSPQVTEPCG